MTQGTRPTEGTSTVEAARRLEENLSRALRGREDAVRTAVAVFLAEGHLLLEDVPGVGKTTLARALAASVEGTTGRVQFTPDLLPSDLTGVTIYRQESTSFEFHPGPLFATVVIGDEINRASPKTQSALLECMQERQVTVDGTSYALPRPFMVIATQNPVEMEGTYPLPEAQRDRFMAQVSIGYPPEQSELDLLEAGGWEPGQTTAVLSQDDVLELIDHVARVYASEPVRRYVLALVRATRTHESIELGASPRAGLQLLALARADAALDGRDFVLPDDVQGVLVPVLAHRLALTRAARSTGVAAADVLADLRRMVPVPR